LSRKIPQEPCHLESSKRRASAGDWLRDWLGEVGVLLRTWRRGGELHALGGALPVKPDLVVAEYEEVADVSIR
jgi:hypothetical protein